VDEVIEHWPERCECGHVFAAGELLSVGEPARHQIEELPVISARVIEHRCPRVRCPGCGERMPGAAQALTDPHQQLGERVRASESLNMDETGWRTAGERRALWGMFSGRHAFFHLAVDRHEDHANGCSLGPATPSRFHVRAEAASANELPMWLSG
jgi:hypothetical protein